MKERWKLLTIVLVFVAAYYVPWANPVIRRSGLEAFMMLQEYARDHVLTCLIPAFFIAGAIAVFVSQASVLKYFGPTRQENPLLFRCLHIGDRAGGLFLYGSAAFCGHLHPGCRHRAGHGFSLFRPRHQRVGHRTDGQDPGMAAGAGTGHRSSPFRRYYGSFDGFFLSKRRCGPCKG